MIFVNVKINLSRDHKIYALTLILISFKRINKAN